MRIVFKIIAYLILLNSTILLAQDFTLNSVSVNRDIFTDNANYNLTNNAIASHNGNIYIVFVEKNIVGGYSTTIGKYSDLAGWEYNVIEKQNQNNPFHAQPSVIVDSDGYIHVTYNMHSSPWQYSVSSNPEDITSWEFKGQALSGNPSLFNSGIVFGLGTASIPGNRITYERFVKDNNGDIYVSYREALLNDESTQYLDRQFSLGISKYSTKSKTWSRVGQNASRVFATEKGFLPQVANITFDSLNKMHLVFNWTSEYRTLVKSRIIYYAVSNEDKSEFFSFDGEKFDLPIKRHVDKKISTSGLYTDYVKVQTDSNNVPYVLIMPAPESTQRRKIIYPKNGIWSEYILTPFGEIDFVITNNDSLILVSSNLLISKSNDHGVTWERNTDFISEESHRVWLDKQYIKNTGKIRFLAQNINKNNIKIYNTTF